MSARRPSLPLPSRCWEVLCLLGFAGPLRLPAPSYVSLQILVQNQRVQRVLYPGGHGVSSSRCDVAVAPQSTGLMGCGGDWLLLQLPPGLGSLPFLGLY